LSREHVLILESFFSFLFISLTIIIMDTTVYRSPLPPHLVAARRGPWLRCWHKRKEEKNREKRDRAGKGDDWSREGDDDRVTGARDALHLKPKYVFSSYLLYYTMKICSSGNQAPLTIHGIIMQQY
jgi:hypothetical protein